MSTMFGCEICRAWEVDILSAQFWRTDAEGAKRRESVREQARRNLWGHIAVMHGAPRLGSGRSYLMYRRTRTRRFSSRVWSSDAMCVWQSRVGFLRACPQNRINVRFCLRCEGNML